MKYDSQADAVLRKTATLLYIKNAPNGAFFGCIERFFEEKLLFSLVFYVFFLWKQEVNHRLRR